MRKDSKRSFAKTDLFSLWASRAYSALGWFFIGALTVFLSLLGLAIFWPLSLLFEKASGRLPHTVSQFWARVIAFWVPYWEIQTQGLERIEKGKSYVVVSNHQSMLDILVLLARLPLHFKFIAKQELFWIPFFGWHLALARYIPLKRGNTQSGRLCLARARRWLRRGVSVVFFPEGTRSPDGKIHEFKAGAFKLALEEKVDLLPLVIAGTREAIPKYSWRVQTKSPLRLQIQKPISVRAYSLQDLDRLRETVRTQIVREFEKLRPNRF